MGDTIFSKIIRREIPADIVYENDDLLAFRDPQPASARACAVHSEAINRDVERCGCIRRTELLGKLLLAAADYAKREGFAEEGYRTVVNCNEHGGQTVFHLHVHLLAGRRHALGRLADPAKYPHMKNAGIEPAFFMYDTTDYLGGGGRTTITRGPSPAATPAAPATVAPTWTPARAPERVVPARSVRVGCTMSGTRFGHR